LIDLGSRGTPTTVIEREGNRQVIIGFDPGKLSKALGI
jgi:hypothetical protein